MLKLVGVVMVMLCLHHFYSTSAQTCPSNQELKNSLRQVEKMLAAHEASYQTSLRSLRKKLGALQNSTMTAPSNTKTKPTKNATCPKPDIPTHGRRLGRVFSVGHEVHFLCKPGYDLIGPRTRVCLESLKWSGQQPMCRLFNSTSNSLPSFSTYTPVAHAPNAHASDATSSSSTSSTSSLSRSSSSASRSASSSDSPSSSSPASAPSHPSSSSDPSSDPSSSSPSPASTSAPPSLLVRPSQCTQYLGSTHCTCDVGFTISGRDNNVCTDIDECEVFPLGQPGRLCVHKCVNTPGSFHCLCPAGYQLSRDGRSCKDIDECAGNRLNNCTGEQVCVNTYGGFQCVSVECPRMKNATYIKTSSMRCERNPCMQGDRACAQAPNSVSFHYLSVVSNMTAPRVLFRVSAARVLGDTLRFGLAGGRGRGHFSVQRSGRQTGTLLLVNPVQGPAALEADVEMSELERNKLLGRYLTKVTMFVSPYEF